MNINSRNLAGALSYLGADVESALLAITKTSPNLDRKVRATLYAHNQIPRLRYIKSRHTDGLILVGSPMAKYTCAMHAVDLITQVIDDGKIVTYLKAKFPEYNLKELYEDA